MGVRWAVVASIAAVAALSVACSSAPEEVSAFDQTSTEVREAVIAATAALPDRGCVAADGLPALPAEVGTFDEVCNVWGGLRFRSLDAERPSFHLGERRPFDPSTCVQDLGDGWWSIVEDDGTAESPCPDGFHFQGA